MGRARHSFIVLVCVFAGALPAPGRPAAAPARVQQPSVRFVDVSSARGLVGYRNERGFGGALALADFDDDGDVDVFVPQAAGRPDQLYVNDGTGHFTQEAGPRGLGHTGLSRVGLWFDYDNDGDLDLLVANDDEDEMTSFHLYRQNPGGTFSEVTQAAGMFKTPVFGDLAGIRMWGGICAGDINNDGWLDVYTVQWNGPAHLFLNDGDGTFTDISESSGVSFNVLERHQPMMYDFNQDGWIDIFAAVDFSPNELWINQKNNTFVDLARAAGVDHSMNEMGVTLGDYDNDGDLDMFVTNIYLDGKHNLLYRNDSVPDTMRFVDVSQAMGVADSRWGWGTTFMDVDNDGDVDLAATNGYFNTPWSTDTSKFFWNQEVGTLPFIEVGVAVGFDDDDWGSALAAADFDMDGDLDLLQACTGSLLTTARVRLYDNQPGLLADQNNWLIVRPRIDGANRFAIGAVVRASGGGLEMMRLISAGTSYLSQEPAEAFFGAGPATALDVRIEWPDGAVSVVNGVAVNQVVTITRPAPPVVRVVSQDLAPGRVRLGWEIAGVSIQTVSVQRRAGAAAWVTLADVTTDGQGVCSFEDTSVTPGESYVYRLSFSLQGMPFLAGEVAVDVPAAELSLAGVVPNPSPAGLNVRFALPDASPATLALHDLGGRLLRRVDVGSLGAGSHSVDLAAGLDLDPGIYWIRLELADRVITRKAALVP